MARLGSRHVEHPVQKVDLVPAEPKEVAPPQARVDGEDNFVGEEKGLHLPSGLDEPLKLRLGQIPEPRGVVTEALHLAKRAAAGRRVARESQAG